MSTTSIKVDVSYPESDGRPMGDNTVQFRWIVKLQGNLDAMFQENPNVFVAGDLLWYPVQGNNKIRVAPDAMVVFGRPKGERGSYLQWLEDNVAPQVVFEVVSPGNRSGELVRKSQFYERHGVQEYYLIDPELLEFSGWIRRDGRLEEIENVNGWVSPQLSIRFELSEKEITLFKPDGTRFLTYLEVEQLRTRETERAERLAARLRELGVDPDEV